MILIEYETKKRVEKKMDITPEKQHALNCDYCKFNLSFDMPTEIIKAVKENNLVIFAGAGISTENKLCFKSSLYQNVKVELEVDNEEELSFSKVMSLFCNQINGRKRLIQKIKERFDYVESFPELYKRATRFHSALGTIHSIKEIITTNWDDYFEKECGATPFVTGEDVAFWSDTKRKVLKIHGSIQNLGSLIMTEEDYNRCYTEMNMGNIGALLKTLLATKVIVYVGYSFGDEDFNKIYDYLVKDMKGLHPHAFMVTLDKSANEKLAGKNITAIVTDGTYFIQTLKERLIQEDHVIDDTKHLILETFLDSYIDIHEHVAEGFNPIEYPQVIYSLCYQDGLIHSLERIQAKKKNGEYSCKGCLFLLLKSYQELRRNKVRNKNYIDVAYIDGYIIPIYYLLEDRVSNFDALNPFYLYGYKYGIKDYDEFSNLIKAKKIYSQAAHKLAVKIAGKYITEGIVYHHVPFL